MCTFGETLDCDDQNSCTIEICDASSGCVSTLNSGACEDGLVCTEGDSCVGGVC